MTKYAQFTLAAIQAAPIYFDREASTEKACRLIQEAAEHGATLAAFGEAWLPGYPFFHGNRDANPTLYWKAAAAYLTNAVEIPSTPPTSCARLQLVLESILSLGLPSSMHVPGGPFTALCSSSAAREISSVAIGNSSQPQQSELSGEMVTHTVCMCIDDCMAGSAG